MHLAVKHHFDETRTADEVVKALLQDRIDSSSVPADDLRLSTDDFLHPPSPTTLSLTDFGFPHEYINSGLKYIYGLHPSSSQLEARSSKSIVIYSDYDADGITGGAILWETLHKLGFTVHPYIGDRVTEGYGFSKVGIDIVHEKYHPALIISVDHGISAREQVAYAKSLGIEVVVTDHHHRSDEKVPTDARAIFHIPSLSGSSTAYYVAKEINDKFQIPNSQSAESADQIPNKSQLSILNSQFASDYIGLAAIGTIADLVPLTGASRSIAYHGLQALSTSARPGIQALKHVSGNLGKTITSYEVGFMIAPRINASGRLDSALDALRLLCTTSQSRANELAAKCDVLNTERQDMVKAATLEALEIVEKMRDKHGLLPKILIIHQPLSTDDLRLTTGWWHEGIIGLIASKLLEKYYRPVIVFTKNEKGYKASARSISGFHLADFLTEFKDLLTSYGGHAAAAGLSTTAENLASFCTKATELASEMLTDELLVKTLKVDAEIPLAFASDETFVDTLQHMAPFGMGNPKPTFISSATIKSVKPMGREGKHLRIELSEDTRDMTRGSFDKLRMTPLLSGVLFSKAADYTEFKVGDQVNAVYSLDWNEWQGRKTIQAKIVHMISNSL
ncbi:MAG: DHH family phosphoesterase [bacterium]